MRLKSKVQVFWVIILACFVLISCSSKEEFDAKGYVKSSLDAIFHEEYEAYAKFIDVSEKEAKAILEQDFQEGIEQEFSGFDGITEDDISEYGTLMRKMKLLAKYEVMDAKEDEDGDYVVGVRVEPSDVYQTLEQNSTDVSNEKISQGLSADDTEVFVSVLTESLQRSIDGNAYGKAVDVDVTVEKDDAGGYGLADAEVDKLGNAMFPN